MPWPPFRAPTRRRPDRSRPAAGRPGRRAALLALVIITVLLGEGCASFPDTGPRRWQDKIENGGPLASPPKIPDEPPNSTPPPPPPPGGGGGGPLGCLDPDPQVVATCLDPISAVAVLPDAQSALVAERATGRVLRVQKGKDPQVVATVPVDAGGGGLIGLVLSPSYAEDQLLYAYAATPGDHRVLRVAANNQITPVLTGIPRTPGNDAGALGVGQDGALLVATGSDGEAAPGSLAGKVLRVDTFGHPFPDNPDPHSPVYTSGLRSPAGLCTAGDTGTVWVTDRLPDKDVLQQVTPGAVGEPAWNWPDRPGVAGCVAPKGGIGVAEEGGSALFLLRTSGTGTFTGAAQTTLAKVYGRLGPAALAPDGLVWLGTVNKGSGGPVVSSDDRAIRLLIPAGGGGEGPD